MQHRQVLDSLFSPCRHVRPPGCTGRMPKVRTKANSQSRSSLSANVITNLYATQDPCLPAGFNIEHQCRRGLWLSSDRCPYHLRRPFLPILSEQHRLDAYQQVRLTSSRVTKRTVPNAAEFCRGEFLRESVECRL